MNAQPYFLSWGKTICMQGTQRCGALGKIGPTSFAMLCPHKPEVSIAGKLMIQSAL